MSGAARLRELLGRRETLVAPGAHDALGARLVQAAGFEACYMTGNGAVASMLGVPDVGLASFSEMLDHARRMAQAIDLPLIADADTGYGGSLNIRRTVRAFARAGIAAIHIEDQVQPKRCGAMAGVAVVPIGEARARIRAALDAREEDILIIARTDAVPAEGLERAIERANAFGEEGADLVYIEMLTSEQDLARVGREVGHPLFYDLLELDPGFVPTVADLRHHGFRIVVNCLTATRIYTQAVLSALRQFRETGDLAPHLGAEMDLHAYEALLGLPELRAWQDGHSS
ncbi:MAG TPA: isocitrate lyase/PEP mutase family protein [Geminicoccaceae bacterium]